MRVKRIDFKSKGYERILRDPALLSNVTRRAGRMAEAAGGERAGYVVRAGQGRTRARAAVIAATRRANVENARNQTLLRSIDAGRG